MYYYVFYHKTPIRKPFPTVMVHGPYAAQSPLDEDEFRNYLENEQDLVLDEFNEVSEEEFNRWLAEEEAELYQPN